MTICDLCDPFDVFALISNKRLLDSFLSARYAFLHEHVPANDYDYAFDYDSPSGDGGVTAHVVKPDG